MCFQRVRPALLALWLLSGPSVSYGQVIHPTKVSINNAGSFTEHEIEVNPGGSFAVEINVETDREVFYIGGMALVASHSGVLETISAEYSAPWLQASPEFPLGVLNPASAEFAATLPYPEMFGPGQSALVEVELSVSPEAHLGSYLLYLDDAWSVSCRVCPAFSHVEIGPAFEVYVTSEPPIEDTDGDGIADPDDACPDSMLGDTVMIGACDSGVANVLFDDGCTMTDLLLPCREQATNHGGCVQCVGAVAQDWRSGGQISGQAYGRIIRCAAKDCARPAPRPRK